MRGLIKFFTSIGAIVLLLIGVGLLAVTIYGFIHSQIFLGDDSTRNIVLGIMLAVSLAIIGGSAEGIYGICKGKPKLICCFQIIVIIFMLIFLGVGIGLVYLPEIFFNGDCSNSNNPVINYANEIYATSINNYCITCPCALDTSPAYFNATYTATEMDYIRTNYIGISPTGAHNTEECIKAQQKLTDVQIALFPTIKQLQKLLSCSNWCSNETNLIYRFNDINSGKPENSCYDQLQIFFNDYSYYGKLGFFIGGGVLFLMFACNMYICCSPERKKRNLRERFMYVVDSEDDGYNYRRR